MRYLIVVAAALAIAAQAPAQCRHGGYAPTYYAPAYHAPTAYYQQTPAAITRTEVRTASGTDVRVTSTTFFAPPGYGYNPPILVLPGTPTTEVISVTNTATFVQPAVLVPSGK